VLDSRQRFTDAAGLYARYRPDYPSALFDWLLATTALGPGARVADLGCGTGIASRQLAARGLRVVGIEPNAAMLAQARAEGGGVRYVRAEATATGLRGGAVDLGTAAQAFHWFPVAETLAELRRVLRPGGWAAAFWNVRAGGLFNQEYDALLHAFSVEYGALRRHEETTEELGARPEVESARAAEFAHRQVFDLEGLRGRAWSSSYVVHGVDDRAGFDRALARLFDRHQRDGAVSFGYRTEVLAFRLAPS
jgi:SAM-dependent methyltransferase